MDRRKAIDMTSKGREATERAIAEGILGDHHKNFQDLCEILKEQDKPLPIVDMMLIPKDPFFRVEKPDAKHVKWIIKEGLRQEEKQV